VLTQLASPEEQNAGLLIKPSSYPVMVGI
jgi:hypothetical protein